MRRFFSLFFLALFLFPFAEIGIHGFSHRNEEVCFVRGTKHIHNLEHSCPICDINVPIWGMLPENVALPEVASFTSIYSEYGFCFFPAANDFNYSPRGPPIV